MGGSGYTPGLAADMERIALAYHGQHSRATHNTISRGQNMGCCKKDDDPLLKIAAFLWVASQIGHHMDDAAGDNAGMESDTFDNDTFDDGGFDG